MAMVVAFGTSSRSSSRRFAPKIGVEEAHARDVAARPVEARDKAVAGPGRRRSRTRSASSWLRPWPPAPKRCRPTITADRPANQIGRPAPAAGRGDCPPSGIRSRRSGPRRSRLPSGPGGTPSRDASCRRASCSGRNPITGMRLLRARTRERQHAAAPPSPAMNSRRLIRSPRRRWRAVADGIPARASWRS